MYETCSGFQSLQTIFLTFLKMRSVMILCPFAEIPNLLMILFAIVTTNEIKIDQNPTNVVSVR